MKWKMRKKNKSEQEMPDISSRRMQANVISIFTGTTEYSNVQAIRINSDRYSLFIMPDYTPIIGEVNGSVRIITDDEMVSVEDMCGFYVLRDNVFHLMIKEKREQEPEQKKEENNE